MEFHKSKLISLKTHEIYNEKWLQSLIIEDPTLLGLGDLAVKEVERRQPRAGRLDLLLSDSETHTRYEVEIQLGATDETHIIRTIEYWDIEKSRYPQYEHVAVIVADNFLAFRARRGSVIAEFRIPRSDEVTARIDDSGIDSLPYDKRWNRYRLRLTGGDLDSHRDLLLEMIGLASGAPALIEE